MIDQADQRKNCVVIVFKGIFIHTQHIGKRCVYMRHVVVHEGIAQERSELPMQFLDVYKRQADCTVIVEPKAEILPPSYSTVEKLLQKLMAANADALFPLRLKCVRLENAPSGKRYIPYVEWEERYEKEGLKKDVYKRQISSSRRMCGLWH